MEGGGEELGGGLELLGVGVAVAVEDGSASLLGDEEQEGTGARLGPQHSMNRQWMSVSGSGIRRIFIQWRKAGMWISARISCRWFMVSLGGWLVAGFQLLVDGE